MCLIALSVHQQSSALPFKQESPDDPLRSWGIPSLSIGRVGFDRELCSPFSLLSHVLPASCNIYTPFGSEDSDARSATL